MKVETNTGFKCEIDENILKQYRFVKAITRIENDNNAVFDMINMLLGDDEERLQEHLRSKLGRYPELEEVASEINDILVKIKEGNEDLKK